MKKLAAVNMGFVALGALTYQDWLFILSIIIGVLNLVLEYLKSRKKE